MNETIENGTPKFSVIIPAYNQARFLDEAIESVLAQTFDDYEIVVVNDGSTDETEAVALHYGNKIRYISQENRGLAGARNSGIRAAKGEWIALLDSDDKWLPKFLERMKCLINQHPRSVTFYCGALCVDEHGNPMKQVVGYHPVKKDRLYHQILRSNFIIPSTVVVRTSAIRQAGYFDQALRSCEDLDIWLYLLSERRIFGGISDVLVHYRVHGSSLSANVEAMQQSHRSVIEKHFGADDQQYDQWCEEKKIAFGGFYRYQLLTNIQRRNDWLGADILRKGIQADPSIISDLDFFYELALGNQPIGYRGTNFQLDIVQNAALVDQLLSDVFTKHNNAEFEAYSKVMFATAYKAIGLAAYNTGQFALCRKYLWKAVQQEPGFLLPGWGISSLLKSMLGIRILRFFRTIKKMKILMRFLS